MRALSIRAKTLLLLASAALWLLIAVTPALAAVTLVDNGFEGRTDGAALSSPPWTFSGTPQRAEYDSAIAKEGSLAGLIQGPTTASYAGVGETDSAGMTANLSEQRFWLYLETANQNRAFEDFAPLAADRAIFVRFDAAGNILVWTNRAGNPNGYTTATYVSVGTYATGWTQFRIVYDFASQTYTLSRRASAAEPWTSLKASAASGYAIPFRGENSISQTHGLVFRAYQNANLWVDEVGYSTTPIVDPDLMPPAIPVGLSGSGGATSASLSWTANTEPDLAGYNVYRGGTKLNASLLTSTSYLDSALSSGGYNYQVTAVDTSNNESARSAAVAVTVGLSDMPVTTTDCGACHASHGFPPPCSVCHGDFKAYHPYTRASDLHVPATVTGCDGTGCHVASLTVEHYRRTPTAGGSFNCMTCHGSADPAVKAAITAGNSACSACHPGAGDHAAAHETTLDPSCWGSSCHTPASNLLPIHPALACSDCHLSTDPAVTSAIASGDTTCGACHSMGSSHYALHADALPSGSCGGCHKRNLVDEHSGNCDLCHESADPKVLAAIATGSVACASCHSNIHPDYISWDPNLPDNEGGPHSGYLATSTKCRVCHSVHRAAAWANGGNKLLPTADATCAGCHTGGTAITAKTVTWGAYSTTWTPEVDSASPYAPLGSDAWLAATPDERVAAITNTAAAGGGGGPHNDSLVNLIEDGYWTGVGSPPAASFAHGQRYGCFTRRCHATNPHGAGGSKYKIFAAKLLFNASPASEGGGSYGGLDAVYDELGATDAAVQRFLDANPAVMTTDSQGNLFVNGAAPDANQTHALVAGLTCGRPSVGDDGIGNDECHAEASYAIVDKDIREQRNHATGITSPSAYRTDNTGEELAGYGGNDSRDWKTGHVAGTFTAVPGAASYAPIGGCTSCHDQTDAANSTSGHFTFPHGQTAVGATNLVLADGVTSANGTRARIWSGYGASVGAPLVYTAGTAQKAYDGQCLKCHRDGAGNGIGLTR